MSKSNNINTGGVKPTRGVFGGDRRWRASRLGNAVKNRGIKNTKKAKKS